MSTAWHIDEDLSRDYTQGRIDAVLASSVEAHLLVCAACRQSLVPAVPRARLDRVWDDIVAVVDAPAPRPLERLLCHMGVREHTARLLGVTPSLRLGWIAASALALLFAVLATGETTRFGMLVFLAVAPTVPVAGVVMAFGRADPAHELALAAPYSIVRLALIRATAVLGVCVALALVTGLALLNDRGALAAWLLPALALTSLTLALSSWFEPLYAGAAISGLWLSGVAGTALQSGDSALFGSAVQLLSLAVAAASSFLIFVRRKEFS
ncbi:zf-HC2 domain-containing protein [Nonomuraea cavernae]|uniref:zf-HC2 domain-containing protein n=1 Tax=Nonomuraea cavernae TaxID=2045107 RepID=UPI0033F96F7D